MQFFQPSQGVIMTNEYCNDATTCQEVAQMIVANKEKAAQRGMPLHNDLVPRLVKTAGVSQALQSEHALPPRHATS